MCIPAPKPIEETDPELAELMEWFCNSNLIKKGHRIDDSVPPEPVVVKKEVGRNDPCVCGSGKKFKKCCLNKRS